MAIQRSVRAQTPCHVSLRLLFYWKCFCIFAQTLTQSDPFCSRRLTSWPPENASRPVEYFLPVHKRLWLQPQKWLESFGQSPLMTSKSWLESLLVIFCAFRGHSYPRTLAPIFAYIQVDFRWYAHTLIQVASIRGLLCGHTLINNGFTGCLRVLFLFSPTSSTFSPPPLRPYSSTSIHSIFLGSQTTVVFDVQRENLFALSTAVLSGSINLHHRLQRGSKMPYCSLLIWSVSVCLFQGCTPRG